MKQNKLTFIALILLITCSKIFAQDLLPSNEKFAYIITRDVVVHPYDFLNNATANGALRIATRNLKLDSVTIDSIGNCVIKFWRFTDTSCKRQEKQKPTKSLDTLTKVALPVDSLKLCFKDNGYYFSMPKKDFQSAAQKYYLYGWSLSFGTLVVPVKMRFGDGNNRTFDFASDFTLGASIGARKRVNHYKPYYLNVLGGFGITSVAADSSTTEGMLTTDSKLAAVTPSIGILAEFYSVQLGIFTGLDFLSGTTGRAWQYQGKPWIAVGLGIQIMSRNSNSTGQAVKTN